MNLAAKLKAWNKDREKSLIKSYKNKGFKASGDWEKLLEPKEIIGTFNIRLKMDGAKYTGAMMDGRRPGKMPPVSKIQKWINNKGLDLNAWGVAKTIASKGSLQYRKPNSKKKDLLSDAYPDEAMKELFAIIKEDIVFDLTTTIKTV